MADPTLAWSTAARRRHPTTDAHRRRPRRRDVAAALPAARAGPAATCWPTSPATPTGSAGRSTGSPAARRRRCTPRSEARDADIERARRRRRPSALRDAAARRRPSCSTRCDRRLPDDQLGRHDRADARRPRPSPLPRSPCVRLREVEIHHVDLGAGYTARRLAAGRSSHAARLGCASRRPRRGRRSRLRAADLDRTWAFGDGGPVVTGTGAPTWPGGSPGAATASGLTSDGGDLPAGGEHGDDATPAT